MLRGPIAVGVAAAAAVSAGTAIAHVPLPTQLVLVGASALGTMVVSGAKMVKRLPLFFLIALVPFASYGPGFFNLSVILVLLAASQAVGVRVRGEFRAVGVLLALAGATSFAFMGGSITHYGNLLTAVLAYLVLDRLFTTEANRSVAYAGLATLMLWTAGLALLQTQGFNPVEALNMDPASFAVEGRVSAAFTHPIVLGIVGAFGVCLLVGQVGWLARAGFVAAISCVLLAQTRIVVLALLVALVAYFLRRGGYRRRVLTAVAILLPLSIFALRSTTVYDSLTGRFSTESFTNSGLQRRHLWEATLRLSRDHPVGVGLGQYSNAITSYNPGPLGYYDVRGQIQVTGGAENLYLHVLAELGWLGLAALIALLGKGLWLSRSNPNLFSFWIVVGVSSFTSYSLLGLPVALLFAMGIALTARHHEESP